MPKTGRRKKRLKAQAVDPAAGGDKGGSLQDESRWFLNPRLLTGLILLILLAFGTYKAWTLYAVYPIPNPDFSSFISIGKTLLAFEIPKDFKRAPIVGILQILISKFLNTDSPELSAGWLLNAVLSVANIILLWQIARQFIGKAASFLAVVAMLNPWVLRSQVNPIAETTMIFFIMSTFYLMFRRSPWAYLTAGIAALVRYECSALLFITFLMDMLLQKDMRQRLKSFIYAAVASIPFLLWMLGTWLKWGHGTGGTQSHYLRHYGHGMVGWNFIRMLWEAAFGVLTVWPKFISAVFEQNTLTLFSQSLAVIFIVTALAYAVHKKQWKMLALVIFLGLYLLVHVMRANSHHRYTVPIAWIVQVIAAAGVYALYKTAGKIPNIPPFVKWIFQGILVLAAVVWVVSLYPALSQVAAYYEYVKGQWLPHAAMLTLGLVLILLCIGAWEQSRFKQFLPLLTIASVACVMVISQQFMAARVLDSRGYYIEFKYLSDWYKANSKAGEKLASRWAGTLRLVNAKRGDDFVHTAGLKAETMDEFIEKCYQNDVVFVTSSTRGSAGTKRGLEHILAVLDKRQSYGPLEYIGRIEAGNGINLYRLRPRPPQIQNQDRENE
jgi:hypothetical protein